MVKSLSTAGREALAKSITEAERKTSAELVAAIATTSDHYTDFVLFYGFLAGSFAATGVWLSRPDITFPYLLTVQLGTVLLFTLLPPLRYLCIRLVAKHTRHLRATHRAHSEYLHIASHVRADTPIVLLYISLAERYVHILPSRQVREKIGTKTWETVVGEFTSALRKDGLDAAALQAVQAIAAQLAEHFPATGQERHFHHPVIDAGA